jgi:hypothetical protein
MFHVVCYRHPAGCWLAAHHGGGVLAFSFLRELADVVANRVRAAGLEARVEAFNEDQIGALLATNGVREEAIASARLRPLEVYGSGIGDRVAFAREIGEDVVRRARA